MKRLHVVQSSYTRRSDSVKTLQFFANGIKVSVRNMASEIHSQLRALKSVFLCILSSENYCLKAEPNKAISFKT